MKLVMIHHWSVEWAASGTETTPLEYASTEQAIVDFEALARASRDAYLGQTTGPRDSHFRFAGHRFDALDFFLGGGKGATIELPEFLTVDEWYQKHGATSGEG